MAQHLTIGIRAMEKLADMPMERLHSRKLKLFRKRRSSRRAVNRPGQLALRITHYRRYFVSVKTACFPGSSDFIASFNGVLIWTQCGVSSNRRPVVTENDFRPYWPNLNFAVAWLGSPTDQNFAHLGFQYCDSSVTRVPVVQRTKIMIPSDERHRQAVQRELVAFEKLENDFNARERKERAARLGLVLDNYSYSPKETSN